MERSETARRIDAAIRELENCKAEVQREHTNAQAAMSAAGMARDEAYLLQKTIHEGRHNMEVLIQENARLRGRLELAEQQLMEMAPHDRRLSSGMDLSAEALR
jgi:hypothetical protein